MSTSYIAVYDACVLVPAPVRDILMQLATTGLVRARWSPDIHQEWMTAVRRLRPDIPIEKLDRTREKMDEAVPDALITGYGTLIDSVNLKDRNDRHVVAAAIRGRASIIVTRNLADFPADVLAEYGLEAMSPDSFVANLVDLYPSSKSDLCQSLKICRTRLKNPPFTVAQYLDLLQKHDFFRTIEELKECSDDL